MLSSVALGEVGIVGSREASRLSRTDKDWCRLLEVCQIFGTLIADEQQVYDLNYLDDQLAWASREPSASSNLRFFGNECRRAKSPKHAAESCLRDFRSVMSGTRWASSCFIPINGFAKPSNSYSRSSVNDGACGKHSSGFGITM